MNKTLVLDLDETLVHSMFEYPRNYPNLPDLTIEVNWDDGSRDKVLLT